MATFTKIPETTLSESLGKRLGKSVGRLKVKAQEALNKSKNKLIEIAEQDANDTAKKQTSASSLKQVKSSVTSIKSSTNTAQKSITSVQATTNILKAPIAALKVAEKALEGISTPVPASVPAAMSTLSELTAQASQTITSISTVASTAKTAISSVQGTVDKISNAVSILEAASAVDNASDKDKAILQGTGVVNSDNSNNLAKLVPALLANDTTLVGIGDLKNVDLKSALVKKLVSTTESGNYVDIPITDSGDALVPVYIQTDTEPSITDVKGLPPQGWSLDEPVDTSKTLWTAKATVSGVTGEVKSWSTASLYVPTGIKSASTEISSTGTYKQYKVVYVETEQDIPELSGNLILVVSTSSAAYAVLLRLLQNLSSAAVSDDLKTAVTTTLSTIPVSSGTTSSAASKYQYVTKNGKIYNLKIIVDPKSPSIASLRYTEAYDSKGILVYTGTKSFATEDDTLLEEAKLYLDQLSEGLTTSSTISNNVTLGSVLETGTEGLTTDDVVAMTDKLCTDLINSAASSTTVIQSTSTSSSGSGSGSNVQWTDVSNIYGTLAINGTSVADLLKYGAIGVVGGVAAFKHTHSAADISDFPTSSLTLDQVWAALEISSSGKVIDISHIPDLKTLYVDVNTFTTLSNTVVTLSNSLVNYETTASFNTFVTNSFLPVSRSLDKYETTASFNTFVTNSYNVFTSSTNATMSHLITSASNLAATASGLVATASFLDSLIGLDTSSVAGKEIVYAKSNRGFYSNDFISVKGVDPTSGGSGIDLSAMWSALEASSSQVINISHIPVSQIVSSYVSTKTFNDYTSSISSSINTINNSIDTINSKFGQYVTTASFDTFTASISTVYRYKGSVATYADLPATGNVGDVYNVVAAYGTIPAGTNYAWNGTTWDALGGSVDLSGYLTTSSFNSYTTSLNKWTGSMNTWSLDMDNWKTTASVYISNLQTSASFIDSLIGRTGSDTVYVKSNRNFFSNGYISCKGVDATSGGAGIDLTAMWSALESSGSEIINISHIPVTEIVGSYVTTASFNNYTSSVSSSINTINNNIGTINN